ncbi:hypothetical protein FGG08_004300 [Glutinoglossum americanum]|uniref:Uncharacterized protein n=1 Tax=Glutinoglossum americanum TaxID=1670608 RepID=A0A9P8L417_9PEZI|nr:hypothetical protein FGG08_004300 [Glutinoglossum americanum]
MASGVMAPLTANGISLAVGTSEKTFAEIRELEKILRLRDEVIAGAHPRIKVPAHLIGKLGPRHLQSPALASPRLSTAETKARPSIRPGQSPQDEPARIHQKSPEPRQLSNSKNVVSEIDPILLTKSEDLVRAEIQLHRQRLERVLKEQLEQRRSESRQRHPHQEPVPEFDVSEVLEKALQIVHPVEGAGGESSDDNSYYSSHDSPIEETENSHNVQAEQEKSRPEESQIGDMEIDDQQAAEDVEKHRVSPMQAASRDSDYWSGAQEAETYVDELRRQPYPSISHGSKHRGRHYYTTEPREVYEGSGQVEPAEGLQSEFQGNDDYVGLEVESEHHSRRGTEVAINHMNSAQGSVRHASQESPEITVVRNHISSPLAPRPERVSPLAVARVPPLAQEHQHEELNSQREPLLKRALQVHSPGSPAQPSIQRKRRQPFDNEVESGGISARRAADSSTPRIKEEPLSPVPLLSVPSIRPAKRRQQIQRVPSLERQPSRDFANRDSFAKPSGQLQRYRSETDISASALPLRVASRGSVRRVERDDHNLRRYASIRYSRRPQSPTYSVQVSPTESRPVLATSHAFADRIVVDQHRHYREPSRGQYPTSARSGRSRSPPPLRERYPSIQQDAVIMAPPSPLPPRITMGKYGREYIPAPAVIRHSAAPPSRQREIEPYYERAATREPVLRVPIPVQDDLYSGRAFVEGLPSFPPSSRRIVEQSPIDTVDYRAYRERDYAVSQGAIPVAREGYVQNRDYPERRISQYEEIVIPREYIPRMQSARPEAGRYETARDFVPRIQSVRPEPVGRDYATGVRQEAERRDFFVPPQNVREYSVRADEGRRDFVPAGNERYNYLSSDRRYADEHALIERPRELPRETGPDGYSDDMRKYQY